MLNHAALYAAHQRVRWMRADAARFLRHDAAKDVRAKVDASNILPALADQRVALEGLRCNLNQIKSDLAWRRLRDAIDQKYSPSQPRVPAGSGRESGRWTSGGDGVSSGPASGDAGTGETSDESAIDGSDGVSGFHGEAGHDDAFGSGYDITWNQRTGSLNDSTRDDEQPTRINDTRIASNEEKPRLGRDFRIATVAEIGRRLVRAFRSENGLFDLFNHSTGTVAQTKIDERNIFGSNSTLPLYTTQDRIEADGMRDVLIEKYPEVMKADNIGMKPNDAIYHAETNVLLRSARENGGTLAGRSIEIYVDRNMCNSCEKVVPLVGLELGNPEIIILDPRRVLTIMNGKIISRRPR